MAMTVYMPLRLAVVVFSSLADGKSTGARNLYFLDVSSWNASFVLRFVLARSTAIFWTAEMITWKRSSVSREPGADSLEIRQRRRAFGGDDAFVATVVGVLEQLHPTHRRVAWSVSKRAYDWWRSSER